MSTAVIGGMEMPKDGKKVHQFLSDVHVAVFFDGTNNNMVQQIRSTDLDLYLNNNDKISVESIKSNFCRRAIDRTSDFISNTISKIWKSESDSFSHQAEAYRKNELFTVSEGALYANNDKGYSNIAILYSLFMNETKLELKNPSSKWHHLYVEGSGATDIGKVISGNVNGLGFGLGDTGAVALVSRAVKHCTEYLNSLSSMIDENTKLHFYLFGFSRGATCARLINHLIVRNFSVSFKREKEFKSYLSDEYFVDDKLAFCQGASSVEKTKLKQKNITVDFLGIYDTVASIGFLKQKDGWTNILKNVYDWSDNYRDNWHYLNVNEYGLYISKDPKKQKMVCHICALDEFRENFALTNIGKDIPSNAVEYLIPGCHSDIGGGYLDGLEQEISLSKKTTKQGKDVVTKIPFKSYSTKPEESNTEDISLDSLDKIGWVDTKWNLLDKKERKEPGHTYTAAEHDLFQNVVYFKRNVRRGWSDISLAMMMAAAKTTLGDLYFFNSTNSYDYTKTLKGNYAYSGDILNFAKRLVTTGGEINKNKEKRLLIVPGENDSVLYKEIRKQFLHFTSSSSMVHLKNIFRNKELNAPMGGSAGNVGNTPNFDLNGVLCRLTYHGDQKGESLSYEKDVHYFYELSVSSGN